MNLPLMYRFLLGYVLILPYGSLNIDPITSEDVEMALKRAREKVTAQKVLERNLVAKGKVLNPFEKLPEARHQLKNEYVEHEIDDTASAILEAATKDLVSRFGLNKDDIKIPLDGEIGRTVVSQCRDERETRCDPTSSYRPIDGRCNNLQRPNEGRIGSCLLRLLESDYEDGVSSPRTQGNTLPNPRDISLFLHRVHRGEDRSDPFLSVEFQGWGQALTHDCLFTAQPQTLNNTFISCCPISADNHPECFPIHLRNDPDFNSSCMNFVRNARCPFCDPNLPGVREQFNVMTPLLDCSHIYGTTNEQAASLRSTNGDGKLASRFIEGVGEMPPENLSPAPIPCGRPGFPCFLVGDFRGNQNLLLLQNQILLFRLHNIIVDRLKELNQHWDGEKLYQEGRRIVIAMYQHINFYEYAPKLIGDALMRSYGLYYWNTRYDCNESPLLLNEFAGAMFRFGHSTVPNYYLSIKENGEENQFPLKDTFFDPMVMYQPGVLQSIARGSTRQCQKSLNRLLDRSVTQFLYVRQNGTPPSLDLAALNIQRGRDHGFQGYKFYAERLLGRNITSFANLSEVGLIDYRTVDILSSIYGCVEDIELWVGIICERRMPDALLGLVAGHIMAEQLYMLKYGDRFFYTHREEAGSFAYAQMQAIDRITLARIFCETFNLTSVPMDPFKCGGYTYSCYDEWMIPPIDLSAWKESRPQG